MRPTVDEIFRLLRNTNQFYSVTFERRTDRPDGSSLAGDLRTMLCRTGGNMNAYKLGRISVAERDAEDFRCAILTVWDIHAYQNNRRQMMGQERAGRNAWRRIDLTTIQQCSIVSLDDLPPDIIANLHEITNVFRLQNMPRQPI